MRVSGDTRGSLRASFLNIGLVEGGVRAVRSKQFSVSSKLSDCLHRRGKELVKKGDPIRHRMYVKRGGGTGRLDRRVRKNHTHPILDHSNLVSPTSRSEPMSDPDHGLDPFPGR